MNIPAEDRPLIDHMVHTDELPALPQRESRIIASLWVEAPNEVKTLGDGLQADPGYLRRIGRYLLWRAGPAVRARARYAAVDSTDLNRIWTFELDADGNGEGLGPDGIIHNRFRTWKESLRDDIELGSEPDKVN
jgi:hypothetical protein